MRTDRKDVDEPSAQDGTSVVRRTGKGRGTHVKASSWCVSAEEVAMSREVGPGMGVDANGCVAESTSWGGNEVMAEYHRAYV
ncbi:hypothetical protein GCM10027059_44950 [Myceligenerans halotolerans]